MDVGCKRAILLACLLLGLSTLLYGCVVAADASVAAPVAAPAWEQLALGHGEASLVGAIDLKALRADPVFGPLVMKLARRDRMGVLLRGSQIDLVADADADAGRLSTWVAVVHDVDGAPTESDVGSNAREAISIPGAWILGEGASFDRLRADPRLASQRIALPSRALFASTLQGSAIPRPTRPVLGDTTEGLSEATMAVLGGAHLEFVLRCRYVDAASAHHAAAVGRLLLAALAARQEVAAALASALTKVDFDVTGDGVSIHVVVSDDLRDVLQDYVERAVGARKPS